jgi:hypothetical protein
MTAVLTPSLDLSAPTLPSVRRKDIHFTTLADGRVAITVRVKNRGRWRTEASSVTLQAAPLGAFVPWRPLTRLWVPALAPGESFEARTEATPPRTEALGDPGRIPPQRLLTAVANPDDRDASRMGQPALPADLFRLLGLGSAYWAGNLNIFIGGQAVERHMAQALRVYPARVNLAMFIVGSGRDAYSFELKGEAAEWDAALRFMEGPLAGMDLSRNPVVPQGEWVEVRGYTMVLLALVPPEGCAQGTAEVHVVQRSTGQEAVVEFSLDPEAAGPGCYTL